MATDLVQYALERAVEKVMAEWTADLTKRLQAAIEAQDIELTGQLKQSIGYMLSDSDDVVAGKISIIFETYGRFQDMKYRHTTPPTAVMRSYVQKIGLDKFKFVPGYPATMSPAQVAAKAKPRNGISGAEYVVNRIGRAIAYSRLKPDWQKRKERQWWNITIHKRIGALRTQLREQLQRDLSEVLVQEFQLIQK